MLRVFRDFSGIPLPYQQSPNTYTHIVHSTFHMQILSHMASLLREQGTFLKLFKKGPLLAVFCFREGAEQTARFPKHSGTHSRCLARRTGAAECTYIHVMSSNALR